ncbi:MAG TPA: DUF4147 domain-containing protein [Caldilineaceae bacterium]|nr:DUF4147 domain-containing protein [Caldilineaceae bacterium]
MGRIQNVDILTSHGHSAGRKALVEILGAGLDACDPGNNVRRLVRLDGDILTIGSPDFEPAGDPRSGEEVIDLRQVGRIFVVGAGKGVQYTAKALEDILGERLTGGHLIEKHGSPNILSRVEITLGAHPVPDEGCVEGCRRILELCADLREDDLVFTALGNGVSALLTLPVEGVSLEDVQRLVYLFQIEKGGPTIDLIPIRNHLDQMKGGKISRHLRPARCVHLLGQLSRTYRDLMYHDLNRWLHVLPDTQTYADAVRNLKKWDAWDDAPQSVKDFLLAADPAQETLRHEEYEAMNARAFCIMPEHLGMLPAARAKAEALGFRTHLLYNNYDMLAEAAQVGKVVSNLAKHSELDGEPFQPPCALFGRNELLVTVGDAKGMGGRNQEYVVAAALQLGETRQVVMGSVDSDGTDGPGHQFIDGYADVPVFTGGIVDYSTSQRAAEMGIDLFDELKRHNVSPALYALGDGIVATPNLSFADLSVTLILARTV